MIFRRTAIPGVAVVEPELREDARGFFARAWCQREFAAEGLATRVVQCGLSFNRRKGTLRGLHYQVAPYGDAKVVRCIRGGIYDVIVDLRPDSAAFTRWTAAVLTAENRRMVYVPENCAHGFQTLEDDTEVFYQMSEFYIPAYARGVRWDDPAFRIEWPSAAERVMSARDRGYPDFRPDRVPRAPAVPRVP